MPEISRFYGIVIRMYFGDHPPPHIHVQFGDQKALFEFRSLTLVAGSLPARALAMVTEWATLHQQELLDLWQRVENLQPLYKLPPLP
jgi:hypothetical protein